MDRRAPAKDLKVSIYYISNQSASLVLSKFGIVLITTLLIVFLSATRAGRKRRKLWTRRKRKLRKRSSAQWQ